MPLDKAPTVAAIFDFENEFESAFCALLKAHDPNLPVYSRLTLPRNEQPTPRILIQFTQGAATGTPIILADQTLVPAVYDGSLGAQIITPIKNSDDAPIAQEHDWHQQLVSTVRGVVAMFGANLNDHLRYHAAHRCVPAASTPVGVNEDFGIEITSLNWAVRFSIIKECWPDT